MLYPLLVRAVNYYRHFLVEENDGRLHLPATHRPEYRTVADCTYDLDLLHWGLNRLVELAEEKRQMDAHFEEPLLPKWKQILHKLTPIHTDETGRMIGRETALTGGHCVQFYASTMTQTEPVIDAIPARGQLHSFGLGRLKPER